MKTGSPEWYKSRRYRIGGSEIASVLEQNPYPGGGRADLYYLKRGIVAPSAPTPDMLRGIALEPVIAAHYQAAYPKQILVYPQKQHYRLKEYPFWTATPDGLINDMSLAEGEFHFGIAEFKCPRPETFRRIERDGISAMYILQCQWYLINSAWAFCELYIFNPVDWGETITYRVEPDAEIQAWQLREAKEFARCVKKGVYPDYPVETMTIKKHPVPGIANVEELPNAEEWQRVMGRLAEGRVALKGAQDFWDAAQGEAEVLMGEDILVQGYGGRISNPYVEGSLRLDEPLLKTKHPDLDLDEYRKQGKPHRQFRFTALNNKEK